MQIGSWTMLNPIEVMQKNSDDMKRMNEDYQAKFAESIRTMERLMDEIRDFKLESCTLLN